MLINNTLQFMMLMVNAIVGFLVCLNVWSMIKHVGLLKTPGRGREVLTFQFVITIVASGLMIASWYIVPHMR